MSSVSKRTPSKSPTLSVLFGARARRWMAERGWSAEGEQIQLSAERLNDGAFSLARIWHSAARLHRPRSDDSTSVIILIGVEGHGSLVVGDRTWHLEPRQMAIVDGRTALQARFDGASARFEVTIERHRLGTAHLILQHEVEVFPVDERYWRTLASLIVTVLSADVTAQDAGFTALKTAIEHTVTAAIMQSPLNTRVSAPGRSHLALVGQAQRIIEEKFDDPQFSTNALARSLAISSAHLHRVFASVSVTPYQMIQQRRANRASDLLQNRRWPESIIAAQSGFSSTRAMRRALQKHANSESARA